MHPIHRVSEKNCARSPISATAELLFLVSSSGACRTGGPILTICTSYEVFRRKDMPFGVRNETMPYLWGRILPQTSILGRE